MVGYALIVSGALSLFAPLVNRLRRGQIDEKNAYATFGRVINSHSP